jgi:hypothetical protein
VGAYLKLFEKHNPSPPKKKKSKIVWVIRVWLSVSGSTQVGLLSVFTPDTRRKVAVTSELDEWFQLWSLWSQEKHLIGSVVYHSSNQLWPEAGSHSIFFFVCLFGFFFLVGLGFKLRASHLQTGTLQLEPCLQSILLWLFWRLGSLTNYLPGLTLNPAPPNVSLPSS